MLWVEDFHVLAPEGQDAAALSAPALDEIFAILDAGLTRTKGSEAADVQAHIGWAHWLNQHIAEREIGPTAEQDLRAALVLEPTNVYANAMLGNWMLQNHGDFAEAMRHFNIAVSTGKERQYVRSMQLGGLIYLDEPGARTAQVKVANAMRSSGEPLDAGSKRRILSFCFDPAVTNHEELMESLSAVSPEDAWKTFLWLDDNPGTGKGPQIRRDFIHANLLEIAGKRLDSLQQYRALQTELKDSPVSLKSSVDAAILRLTNN